LKIYFEYYFFVEVIMKSFIFTAVIASIGISPLLGMLPEKPPKRKEPTGVITRNRAKKLKFTDPSKQEITAFFEAISNNDVAQVSDMLDEGFPANVHEDGLTALTVAAIHNCTDIIHALVHRGANIDDVNDDSSTPLIYAARYQDATDENYHEGLRGIQQLLACNANATATDRYKVQALRYAVEAGKINVVRLLLNRLNQTRQKALADAWAECPMEIIDLSLSFLPSLHISTRYCETLIIDAISADRDGSHLPVIQELISAHNDHDFALYFVFAFHAKKTQIVAMFLDSFLDQLVTIAPHDMTKRCALFRIAAYGFNDMVKHILTLLKKRGTTAAEFFDIIVQQRDAFGNNMLECAHADGHHNVVESLINALALPYKGF
jgi:ankyrin repeat protein